MKKGKLTDKYIIYGAGHDGQTLFRYLRKENVLCFCDEKKAGSQVCDTEVISPDDLKDISCSGKVVVAVSKPQFLAQIVKRLSDMNIEYILWQEMADDVIRQEGAIYSNINQRPSFEYDHKNEYIITTDRYDLASGKISSYFHQDLWAAKLIYEKKPDVHYDIGSRVDGFITHLLSFGQKVVQIDIRPLDITVDGYGFVQADATELQEIEDNSIGSLSALCSLEHFGLGRYGDDIDPEACFRCFEAIQRVMKRDGYAYISVPIGKEHLEFNAHRVFFPQTIIDSFERMELAEFSVCFGSKIERNVDIHKYDNVYEYGGNRFGLFLFHKK